MSKYNVHIYREMKLYFPGIEAESPEAAAELASKMDTADADDIVSCDGIDLGALVDVHGDEDFEHSTTIDFEPQRQINAAAKMLTALTAAERFIQGFEGDEIQDGIDELLTQIRAAIADPEGK